MKRRITFTVGDKEYSLRFGTNAMARFEERTGEPAFKALEKLESGAASIVTLRGLFRAALEQEATDEEVGDLMDDLGTDDVPGLQRAMELFGEAVELAYPKAAANPQTPREKKTPATP